MEILNKLYRRALEGIGDGPSFKRDWRWALFYSLCVYAAVLALRLSFAGRWDNPDLWVNGERIMATHDAYFWLAKARGIGRLAGYPLAEMAAFLSRRFGVGLGTIGFWAPAFFSALVAVACWLWGWLLGGRQAGVLAAVAGALTPGFFYRSRLGYYDTDMFTLLGPLLTAWLLAYWLGPLLRRGWFVRSDVADAPRSRSLWLILAFGFVSRLVGLPHQDIVHFDVLCLLLAVLLVLAGGRPGKRIRALYGLIVFSLAAFPGSAYDNLRFWPLDPLFRLFPQVAGIGQIVLGVALAAGIAYCYERAEKRAESVWRNPYLCVGVLVACLVGTRMVVTPVNGSWRKLMEYFFPGGVAPVPGELMGPVYPSILQSIVEAKLVPLNDILYRGAYTVWLGWLCLGAGVVVLLLRPAALLLTPMVLLHLLSVRLGARFSMFGGAALYIFLGVAVYWLCRWVLAGLRRRELAAGVVQAALGCVALVLCHAFYAKLPITPVMSREHAHALMELGERTGGNGRIWTWWDWGYASQYYAGCPTVVDGGRHAGREVFPVAFVLSTEDPEKADHMVRFSAQYPAGGGHIGLSPDKVWDGAPRKDISRTLAQQLARRDYPAVPPQYLVVSWKDLLVAKWITYFGNWNLETGATEKALVASYGPGELAINVRQGAVMSRNGGGLVKDIAVLTPEGVQTQHYFMNAMASQLLPYRQHAVVNRMTGQTVLMDRTAYRSLLTRLFIGDPQDPEITPYFKLVVDELPFARIYEVVQNTE